MLTGGFRTVPLSNGSQTFLPFARACLTYGQHKSVENDALIDTGASINLISIHSVTTLLGITPEDAKKGRKISISPVGKTAFAYGFKVNIALRPSTNSLTQFIFSNAFVYVVENELPQNWPILIGQFNGFEERILIHLNRQKKRYWQIRT